VPCYRSRGRFAAAGAQHGVGSWEQLSFKDGMLRLLWLSALGLTVALVSVTPNLVKSVADLYTSALGSARIGLIFTRIQEGTQPGQLTQTGQTNGVFNTVGCHAQCRVGELAGVR